MVNCSSPLSKPQYGVIIEIKPERQRRGNSPLKAETKRENKLVIGYCAESNINITLKRVKMVVALSLE